MAGKHSMSHEEEEPKQRRTKKTKKKGRGLRILGRIFLVLIIIILIIAGLGYWFVADKFGKMQQVDLSEEDLGVSAQAEETLARYRNIAIFGVDSRSSNLEQGNRSDCIIIASLDMETNEVRLVSVYRDTYVQIDGHGLDKINHAYSYGSAALAIKTLNKNLDLNITEFVTVNFDSVADAVDKLGGISITIESQEELNYLNSYIDETARVTGKSNDKLTSIGKQTINGVQAVAYSRIRYTAGGDAKRTERMRNVIQAMANKLKTKSLSELNSFVDFMLPKVYTNITGGDILSLLPSATNFSIGESIGWPYVTKGITLSAWYGVPVTLESNVIQLHQELFSNEEYTVSDEIKEISDAIVSRTGYSE